MKSYKRYLRSFVLVFLVLSLCACGESQSTGKSVELDLDYVGEETDQQQEETPWYAWITDAFSFGKKEKTDSAAQTQPDSVAEFYTQGTEAAESEKREEAAISNDTPSANSQITDVGQSEKDDQNDEDLVNDSAADKKEPVTEQPVPESKKNSVTITIRCDTAVNNGMHLESKWSGIVPASGCILPVTTVEIEEGDTVFDVLSAMCDKYKIHMEYSGGTSSGCYVEGINNLYEFDGGRWSGWMYCVNDWYPNYGCGVYFVKAGDVIEWNYTCDLGCDLENGDPYGYGKEWKDNHD